ncbi:MAG: shikimate kinase [Candidatus Marinamargulisbacteria bacterium]
MKTKHQINLKKSVIFFGMAGVGKSSIGSDVSKHLNLSFFDTDKIIETKNGTRLSDLIENLGIDKFKALEATTVIDCLGQNTVISPGGSFIYAEDQIKLIRHQAMFIYLYDEMSNILNRIPNLHTRGIIGLENNSFEDLFNDRHQRYTSVCDVQFNINHHGFKKTTDHIIEYLKLQA